MVQKSCTTWDVKNLITNGINYQPQLVFSPDFQRTINSIEATQYLKDGFNSFEQIPHDDLFLQFYRWRILTKRHVEATSKNTHKPIDEPKKKKRRSII